MASRIGNWILAIVCLLVAAGAASAVAPEDVTYQGRMLDAAGDPLTGSVDIEIGVWDSPVGGTRLYRELHQDVSLRGGIFNVLIGTGDFTEGIFDADLFAAESRYLELIVDTEVLEPRQPFSSVAYALQSGQSDAATYADTAGDADTVDGSHAASLDQSGHVSDAANPHGVTAGQLGAATSADLTTHGSDASAHHARYADGEVVAAIQAADGPGSGLDADTVDGTHAASLDQSAHVSDTANPHTVAAAQVGAATSSQLASHEANASSHHYKTTSFGHLEDQARDDQIPSLIARDSELTWSNLSGIPAGFADGVDHAGITSESDPQIGSNTTNRVPKWNGSALVSGSIYDDGDIGIDGDVQVTGDYTYDSARNHYLQLHPAEFLMPDGECYEGNLWDCGTRYCYAARLDATCHWVWAFAPVRLPEGAHVEEITFYFVNENPMPFVVNVWLSMRNVTSTSISPIDMAEVEDRPIPYSGSTVQEVTDDTVSQATISNYAYRYSAVISYDPYTTGSSQRFHGARIRYTLTSLRP